MVRDHEMLETIASSETLDHACDALIDLANANGGKDNITVVLAKLR
jgi:serine/threonine protein phosphatase PrpC